MTKPANANSSLSKKEEKNRKVLSKIYCFSQSNIILAFVLIIFWLCWDIVFKKTHSRIFWQNFFGNWWKEWNLIFLNTLGDTHFKSICILWSALRVLRLTKSTPKSAAMTLTTCMFYTSSKSFLMRYCKMFYLKGHLKDLTCDIDYENKHGHGSTLKSLHKMHIDSKWVSPCVHTSKIVWNCFFWNFFFWNSQDFAYGSSRIEITPYVVTP